MSEMLLLGSWREKNGGGIVTAARASQHGVNRRLWEASERGSSKEIDRSLLDGAEVDSKGPGLWTALHFAARFGHTKSAERLIEAGARTELRSKAYFTALHHAAMRGHAETARRLVELGADIDAVTLDGFTAMDWAERNGHIQTMLQLSALKDKQKPGASGRPGPGTVTEFDASGAVVRVRHVGLVPIAFPEEDPFVRMDRFEWEGRPPPVPPQASARRAASDPAGGGRRGLLS